MSAVIFLSNSFVYNSRHEIMFLKFGLPDAGGIAPFFSAINGVLCGWMRSCSDRDVVLCDTEMIRSDYIYSYDFSEDQPDSLGISQVWGASPSPFPQLKYWGSNLLHICQIKIIKF